MVFSEKVSQYVLKHTARLGIGVGIWLIMMGVYILIIASHAGTGFILMGIAFISMNLLEKWKPLLMLICTVVALGLACWILVSKPGDNTAKRAAVVHQEAMAEASKSNAVLEEAANTR